MDQINIRDLSLRAIIGVYPDERRERQDVLFNITLHADLSAPEKSDCIEDTVDYKTLKKQIIAWVEASSFNLLEALAGSVAALCLKDKRVKRAVVTADKPAALRFAKSVAVTIDRTQEA
ncbi:MAG: dihydroneopterin aldolase [Fibrobacterota bacterium]